MQNPAAEKSFLRRDCYLKPPHLPISPYWRIEHQEAYQQCHADESDPSVKGFYANASECVRVGYEKIADSLGNVIVETFAIKRATDAAAYHHVKTVENHQPLKKMLKIHTVVQRNHKHYAQARIRRSTHH